jgi:hypothetical protein
MLYWRCTECNWRGTEAKLLTAPNPFDPRDTISGCPECKSANELVNACDEPGCKQDASCGWPSPKGYRRTCNTHYDQR